MKDGRAGGALRPVSSWFDSRRGWPGLIGPAGGAALDVFPSEPFTEHPLFGRLRQSSSTPHRALERRGADRAGVVTAEQG